MDGNGGMGWLLLVIMDRLTIIATNIMTINMYNYSGIWVCPYGFAAKTVHKAKSGNLMPSEKNMPKEN